MSASSRMRPPRALHVIAAIVSLFMLIDVLFDVASLVAPWGPGPEVLLSALAHLVAATALVWGLFARRSWARWWGIASSIAGPLWSFTSQANLERRAGGSERLPTLLQFVGTLNVVGAIGSGVVLVLLLLPQVGDWCEGASNEDEV